MKKISRESGTEEWLKSMNCRNSRTWIWIVAPAFNSCEPLGQLCNPSPCIPTSSINNNMQSIKWLWALNVHNPGNIPAHSRCSSLSLSPLCHRCSGDENPLTYFHNPFKLLQVKSSLFNLNIFSSHLNWTHHILFSKEIRICLGFISVCCYPILHVLEASELSSKWLWDFSRI